MSATKHFLSDIQLDSLYQQSEGNPDIVVAIIDGAVDGSHDDLKSASLTVLNNNGATLGASCSAKDSPSCQHGTFVAGILAADRESEAPGICPQCSFVSRPIFCEANNLSQCPAVTQTELATAVRDAIDAGANIINMSIGLSGKNTPVSAPLRQAYDQAEAAGVLLVGASGNQASEQVNSIFQHPWVIAVSAMDQQ
ncbi:MAG: S8 family serine peptidase, partial [Algicola sp.]|nr:S8 family serine peptidase [Algicola sp.]